MMSFNPGHFGIHGENIFNFKVNFQLVLGNIVAHLKVAKIKIFFYNALKSVIVFNLAIYM